MKYAGTIVALIIGLFLVVSLTIDQAMAASQEISGRYDTIQVKDGEYIIQNNVWGASTAQTITVPDTDQTGFIISLSEHNQSTVASYPAIFKGNHWGNSTNNSGMPIQVGNITSANSSWDISVIDSGAWNCAYDIWFHKTSDYSSGMPNGAELMIWINYMGSYNPGGSQVATADIAGTTWEVWFRNSNPVDITYRITTKTTSVSFDINEFIGDAVSRGYISDSWYLTTVEAGFEIWQGGENLAVNSFSASVSGSVASTTTLTTTTTTPLTTTTSTTTPTTTTTTPLTTTTSTTTPTTTTTTPPTEGAPWAWAGVGTAIIVIIAVMVLVLRRGK